MAREDKGLGYTCRSSVLANCSSFQDHGSEDLPAWEDFLLELSEACEGMSGASLAGVARAAASHALERVVGEYSSAVAQSGDSETSMMDCLVTRDDFNSAIQDVNESAGDSDWELTDDEQEEGEDNDELETRESDNPEKVNGERVP